MAIPIRTASEVNAIGRALPATEGEIAVPLPGGYSYVSLGRSALQILLGQPKTDFSWPPALTTERFRPSVSDFGMNEGGSRKEIAVKGM